MECQGPLGSPWDQPHSKAEGEEGNGDGRASYTSVETGLLGGVTRVSAKCQGMLLTIGERARGGQAAPGLAGREPETAPP